MSFQCIDLFILLSKLTLITPFDLRVKKELYHWGRGNLISPTDFATFTSPNSSKSIGFKTAWPDASELRAELYAPYNAPRREIRAIRINFATPILIQFVLQSLKVRSPDSPIGVKS